MFNKDRGIAVNDIEVKFSNNDIRRYRKNTTYYEMSKDFNNGKNIIGVEVNNKIVSLNDKADSNCTVKFISINDTNGNRIYVAGLKMVFEYAIKKIYPDIKIRYSFSLPHGIGVNIEYKKYLNNEDISNIRKEMANVVTSKLNIEKLVVKAKDGYKYYQEYNEYVKAENIQNITDHTIVLYRLDDLINYYYSEMPLNTGYINKYEIKYLGKNIIVINYPDALDNGKLPEFINYRNILNSYIEGQNWLSTMGIKYINDINRTIYESKIASFVKSCELNFNIGINETAKKIANNSNYKCVMITGPTSSGKTTVTKRLANYLEIYGLDPIVISVDDYYVNREDNPKDENGEYDFECIQACDTEYLRKDIINLFNGMEVRLPKFNFVSGKREISDNVIKLKDNSIILLEGLHTINDDLLPIIPETIKYKIFISPYIPLCLDEHNYISTYDLRLIRRIVRDFRTRGYNVESTIHGWKKVRSGEEKYMMPYVHQADTIINTSLAYELGVLKVFVEPLLFSVPKSSPYYIEARRLLSFLKQFFAINPEFIPDDSIIREFIGGKFND